MAEYANLDELVADYLPEVRSDAELAALGRILTATTRAIDSYCDRAAQYFAPVAEGAEAEARYFRGENKRYLRLPAHVGDIVTLTVWESGAVLDFIERDFRLYRPAVPGVLNWLFRQDSSYSVTAVWGYAATPTDITEACRQLVVHFFERQRGTIGQVTPNGFVIERDMPPPVKMLLEPYKRREFEV